MSPRSFHAAASATALLFLFCVVFPTGETARVSLRPPGEGLRPSIDWKSVFTSIAAVVEDDDFQDSLRDYLRTATAEMGHANYCRMTCVVCNDAMQMVGMNLTDVAGSIAWGSIPKGVISVIVSNSSLRGEASLDISTIPHWVKELHMHNITFVQTAGSLELKLRKRQTTLHTFECVRCGVTAINWASLPALSTLNIAENPLGELDVSRLPPTLRSLNVSSCNLTIEGTALQSLPPPLTVLDVSHNNIHGPLTSVTLPSGLEVLNMSHNAFSGSLHVDLFPFTLSVLDISFNGFSGSLSDMSTFLGLHTIIAHHNQLTRAAWSKLPGNLVYLDISFNQLEDQLLVSVLPATLTYVDLSHNHLSGSILVHAIPPAVVHFDVSYNKLSGPIDLTKLSDAIRFVYIQHNQFTGVPDLTNLPVDLRRIIVHDNHWDSLMPPLYL